MIFLQAVVIKMKVILKIADHFHTIHSYKKIRVFKRTRNKEREEEKEEMGSCIHHVLLHMSLMEKKGHILNDNTTFSYLLKLLLDTFTPLSTSALSSIPSEILADCSNSFV